jgi:hypothetical protein
MTYISTLTQVLGHRLLQAACWARNWESEMGRSFAREDFVIGYTTGLQTIVLVHIAAGHCKSSILLEIDLPWMDW